MAQPDVNTSTSVHQGADSHDARMQRNQALIGLLNAWEQEDETEQRETLQFLMRALDEDR